MGRRYTLAERKSISDKCSHARIISRADHIDIVHGYEFCYDCGIYTAGEDDPNAVGRIAYVHYAFSPATDEKLWKTIQKARKKYDYYCGCCTNYPPINR